MKKSIMGGSKETPVKKDSGHRKRVMWKITLLTISVSQPVCQPKQKERVLGKWYITVELSQLNEMETIFFPTSKNILFKTNVKTNRNVSTMCYVLNFVFIVFTDTKICRQHKTFFHPFHFWYAISVPGSWFFFYLFYLVYGIYRRHAITNIQI